MEKNFSIDAGTDLQIKVSFADAQGQPVNISSYKAAMQVRNCYGSDAALDTLTTENGRITKGDTYMILNFTNVATSGLKCGSLVYDLKLISAAGKVSKVMSGKIRVSPEVTKIG